MNTTVTVDKTGFRYEKSAGIPIFAVEGTWDPGNVHWDIALRQLLPTDFPDQFALYPDEMVRFVRMLRAALRVNGFVERRCDDCGEYYAGHRAVPKAWRTGTQRCNDCSRKRDVGERLREGVGAAMRERAALEQAGEKG